MRLVTLACKSRLAIMGMAGPTNCRMREINSPSLSSAFSATAAPCKSKYTPSKPWGKARCTSSKMAWLMRSNASWVTYEEGVAPAQAEGTSSQCKRLATSMKPAMGMLMPESCSITACPRMKAGKDSPRLNAVQSAKLGAKVLVSC